MAERAPKIWHRLGLKRGRSPWRRGKSEGSGSDRDSRLLSGFWKLLNSPILLLLLSTIAVSWGTKLYTDYQAREQFRSDRRDQAMRIVSEISLRSIRLSSIEHRRQRLLRRALEGASDEELDRIRDARSAYLDDAGAIIRGSGDQGTAAADFSGTHLGILLRQNDLLTGYESGALPLLVTWVESERFPLRSITHALERYVVLQELGLRAGLLPLLPGDDSAREEFEALVRRRGDAIPAQMRTLFNQNYELTQGDAELDGALDAKAALNSIGNALRPD